MNKQINYFNLYLDSIKNSFVIKNPLLIYDSKAQKIDLLNEKINQTINYKLEKLENNLINIKNSNIILNPNKIFEKYIKDLDVIINKLELLNPLKVLGRGYSLTYLDKKIIKDINDVKINDKINIKLKNGNINATIDEIMEEK